jgi:serine/threonine protein kinase
VCVVYRDILEKSARGEYSMEGKEWEGVSSEAKDLVKKMLTVEPDKRITTAGQIIHTDLYIWFLLMLPSPPPPSLPCLPSPLSH